jgi:hypothetical protein
MAFFRCVRKVSGIIDRGHMIFNGVASRLQGIMLDITKLAVFIVPNIEPLGDIISYGAG